MSGAHATGPVPMTAHEQAMTKLLASAARDDQLHAAARALAADALEAWRYGHELGRTLFTHPIDADARLGFLRWGLLAELSAIGSGAVPLTELQALGGATADGWTVAVDRALRGVVRDGPRRRPERTAPAPYRRGWEHAAEALADRDQVSAPRLAHVENVGAGVELTLAHGGGAPLSLLRWFESGRHVARTRAHDAESWRAFNAIAGGLHAVDRMQLDPAVAAGARKVLAEYLVGCVTGRHEPRAAIEGIVTGLATVGSRGRRAAPPADQPWRYPAAFGLIATALDRLAGTDGGPLRELVPGTAVHVLRADGRSVQGYGRIVESPEAAPVKRSRRRHARHQRDQGEPVAHVRLRDGVRKVPVSRLRLYRIPLFA